MNKRLENWLIGVIITGIIFPVVLKFALSFFLEIDLLQAWGLISLGMVLIEGFKLATLTDSEYEE